MGVTKDKLNLIEKMVLIREAMRGITKDNKGFGYKYVSGSQVLDKIRPKMDELKVFLKVETKDISWQTFNYKNTKGEEKIDFIVTGTVVYTWVNGEEPTEREITEFPLMGQQDDISKALGSALTYSERYFILKTLQAPTDTDDPDSRDTTGRRGTGFTPNKATATFTRPIASAGATTAPAGGQCEGCNIVVNANVAKFSKHKFNKVLCMNCQKKEG